VDPNSVLNKLRSYYSAIEGLTKRAEEYPWYPLQEYIKEQDALERGSPSKYAENARYREYLLNEKTLEAYRRALANAPPTAVEPPAPPKKEETPAVRIGTRAARRLVD